MKFVINVTTALSLLSVAVAAPTASQLFGEGWQDVSSEEVARRMASGSIEKRTVGGIYLCTGENYTGTCGYKVQPVCYNGQCKTRSDIDNHCVVLTSPYLRNVGSFGPDQGATVFLSNNGNCHEAVSSISYPGSKAFFEYGNGIGRQITSFLVTAN